MAEIFRLCPPLQTAQGSRADWKTDHLIRENEGHWESWTMPTCQILFPIPQLNNSLLGYGLWFGDLRFCYILAPTCPHCISVPTDLDHSSYEWGMNEELESARALLMLVHPQRVTTARILGSSYIESHLYSWISQLRSNKFSFFV